MCALTGHPASSLETNAPALGGPIEVPVFFHVITGSGGIGNVTDAQIDQQMIVLNAGFAATSLYPRLYTFVHVGTSRVESASWFNGMQFSVGTNPTNEGVGKQALSQDPAHILNVYTAGNLGGPRAYARYPFPIDYDGNGPDPLSDYPEDSYWHGVVLKHTVMPGGGESGGDSGRVLIHEVGHYLGLLHTWGPNDAVCELGNGATTGDEVADTPPQLGPSECGSQIYVCPFSQPPDPSNYMNTVSVDTCWERFTPGQNARMSRMTAKYRPSLGGPPAPGGVTEGVSVWFRPGRTFRYAESAGLHIAGTLNATGVILTAANPAVGWYGVNVSGTATLDGTRIDGVRFDNATFKRAPSAIAVMAGGTATLQSGTVVTGTIAGQGVEALGQGATVIIEGSETRVSFNDGGGVIALGGGTVTIREQAQIINNSSGGVFASGFDTTVDLDRARVQSNTGSGLSAFNGGTVRTTSAGASNLRTVVSNNPDALVADAGGSITVGSCSKGTCANANHFVSRTTAQATTFDARAYGGGAVRAQGNDWGNRDVSCIRRDADAKSTILITDVLNPGAPCSGNRSAAGIAAIFSTQRVSASAARGMLADVLLRVVDAEAALADGDEAAAFASLADALAYATTDDDRAGAWSGAARMLAVAQPASFMQTANAAAADPAVRPWALRALAVAHASAGRALDANASAAALAVGFLGGPDGHAAFGLGVQTRLATEAGDSTAALTHLVALYAEAPTGRDFAMALALAAAAFPGANLDSFFAGAPPGTLVKTGEETGSAAGAEAGLSISPNPTDGDARVRLMVPMAARVSVSVFDALGRAVIVIQPAEVAAGTFDVRIDTARLPAGVYVVWVDVVAAGQPARVSSGRLTVVR